MGADLLQRARCLRRSMTEEERRLWWLLRKMRGVGFCFRRQHPLGPYIADFVCLKARLVVELDGLQHLADRRYDERRDKALMAMGFRILRFWNNQLWDDEVLVLERIEKALVASDDQAPGP